MLYLSSQTSASDFSQGLLAQMINFLHVRGSPGMLGFLHSWLCKLAHLTEYSIFALLLCGVLGERGQLVWRPRRAVICVLLAAAYSLTDEFHQLHVPGRRASLLDCALDAFGASLAMLVPYTRKQISLLRRQSLRLDMLKKNLHSVPGNERGKHGGCFWIEPLRALVSSLIFFAFLPTTLAAQSTSLAPQAAHQAAEVYTNGIQAPLLFEGESLPGNQVSLSMGASTFYDDNIFLNNSLRFRDEALSIDSALDFTRHTDRLTAWFDYVLFFPLYRQFDQFDRLNHAANLNLAYQLTSRVILGLYDTFSYQNGVWPVLTGEQMLSGPAPPTALDQVIIPYTTRVLLNSAILDLTFVKSRRTWLTFSGGYNEIKFGSRTTGSPLYNGNGFSGGLTFQHLVTEHTSFGVLLLHQDTSYQGGQVFGSRLRSQIESTILSVGSRLSPTVTITVFGGPQYIRTIGEASGKPGITEHFHPSGGGSITKEVRKTALDLSFRRIVYLGGGLYTSAISTNATFEVRQRLVGRWEADFSGGAAQLDASLFKLANGRTDGLLGEINISRPIFRGSVFRIAYDSRHELSKGTLPISADFDRNRVTVGIDYQLKALPLGR